MKHDISDNEEYREGKKFAQCGDFYRARDYLKDRGLLQKCVALTKEKYQSFFIEKKIDPEEKMWEAITILGLYDIATLLHSLRTFSVTKDIVTTPLLGPRGETIILQEYVEKSGVSLYELLMAALGHDIGKIKIPVEILHNSLTDEEMNRLVIAMIKREENINEITEKIKCSGDELRHKSDEEIISLMYQNGVRPVNIVPLSEAFPETKYPKLLSLFKELGFSEDQTIRDVAKIHEAEGQKIFEKLGEPIIADLVGHHHNYQKEPEHELRFVMKIPALKSLGNEAFFGVYNIIKIADTLDSLQSKRPYKNGMSKISALAELSHQALTHRLEKSICYLWVSNEYTDIVNTMKKSGITDYDLKEKTSIETIEKFLNETRAELDRRYTER